MGVRTTRRERDRGGGGKSSEPNPWDFGNKELARISHRLS